MIFYEPQRAREGVNRYLGVEVELGDVRKIIFNLKETKSVEPDRVPN